MSEIHDVRLDLELSVGARGGPEWTTQVTRLASGREFRNGSHAASRRRWDMTGKVLNLDELERLTAFFEARQGRLFGFLFRDATDASSAVAGAVVSPVDQPVGTGDGETDTFQLSKQYESGGAAVSRMITRPAPDSVRIALDGAEQLGGWSLATGGAIVFDTPPVAGAVITAGFEFDVPVRFDMDRLESVLSAPDAVRLGPAAVIEILE